MAVDESSSGVGLANYLGWPDQARALVERSIAAHGGADRWRAIQSIHLPLDNARGLLLTLKGLGRTFGSPASYEVRPHQRTTLFHRYPDAGHRGVFADGTVSIESITAGDAHRDERPGHRASFRGWRKYRRWNWFDALYFFGYAVAHYHALPFTLPQTRFIGLRQNLGHDGPGLEVEFASDVHTHGRRQRFFFDGAGRIARHDYTAEVIGAWVRGCHFWERYAVVDGFPIACRRRVVARFWGRPTPLTVLTVDLGAPAITLAS